MIDIVMSWGTSAPGSFRVIPMRTLCPSPQRAMSNQIKQENCFYNESLLATSISKASMGLTILISMGH